MSQNTVNQNNVCTFYCPKIMLSLLTIIGFWFMQKPFSFITVHGDFWTWVVMLFGVSCMVFPFSSQHQKGLCPYGRMPKWEALGLGLLLLLIGIRFLLGDMLIVFNFGVEMAHVITFFGSLYLLIFSFFKK